MSKKDLRRNLLRRSGFDSKRNHDLYFSDVQARILNLVSRQRDWESMVRERFGKLDPEPESVDERVVGTVTARREWMHKLRSEAGQDCYLLDYRKSDPELSLDWESLR